MNAGALEFWEPGSKFNEKWASALELGDPGIVPGVVHFLHEVTVFALNLFKLLIENLDEVCKSCNCLTKRTFDVRDLLSDDVVG